MYAKYINIIIKNYGENFNSKLYIFSGYLYQNNNKKFVIGSAFSAKLEIVIMFLNVSRMLQNC